jgi:tetratricopeptide (TPR) repeat protein
MKTGILIGLAAVVALTGSLAAGQDSPAAVKAGHALVATAEYSKAVIYLESIGVQSDLARESGRLTDLAKAYLYVGRFTDAENTASKALKVRPDQEEAWYIKGSAQVFEMQKEEAKATFAAGIVALKSVGKTFVKLSQTLDYLGTLAENQIQEQK